jgi:hypothetical protein
MNYITDCNLLHRQVLELYTTSVHAVGVRIYYSSSAVDAQHRAHAHTFAASW